MIACCLKRGRHFGENPLAIVVDNTHFAMDYVRGASDGAAEGLGDGLMPQTHAQQGDISVVGFGHERQANPRFIRVARPGGEDYCRGVQRDGFVGGDCIVAFDSHSSFKICFLDLFWVLVCWFVWFLFVCCCFFCFCFVVCVKFC